MQTQLVDSIRNTPEGQEAEAILRSCVHCGFCTATCPTYQLLSDELDGPRGRIYLIKQMLEGKDVSENTLEHLDRCLLCRSCETTCPSGVQYGRLLDYGRDLAEKASPRCAVDKLKRRAILSVVPHAGRFGPLLKLGQLVRPVMPAAIRA
ncbi:MAG: 4Fe-4S dicluster domain-containing protein, partial [Gammaproteobacteria bacterium]